jgi:serine/threonine-protein kinase
VLRAVQERLIVPPARLNPAVAAPLDTAVMRALERDRGRRWPTAHELERALAEVLLTGARSLEDTDVGAFLRRMFPEEAGVAEPVAGTASIPISLSISAPPDATDAAPGAGDSVAQPPPTVLFTPAPRQPAPTVVFTGGAELAPTEVSPGLRGRAGACRRWCSPSGRLPRRRPSRCAPDRAWWPAGASDLPPGPASPATPRAPAADSLPAVTGAETGQAAPGESTGASAAQAAAAPASPNPQPATVASTEPDAVPRSRGGAPSSGVARARLVIRAKPWAELRVDGKRAGYVQGSKTVRLPAGRHLVELTGPDGVAGTYTVQLVEGRTATLEHPPGDR